MMVMIIMIMMKMVVILDDINNDEPLQIFNDIYLFKSHMRLRKASLPLTTRVSHITIECVNDCGIYPLTFSNKQMKEN